MATGHQAREDGGEVPGSPAARGDSCVGCGIATPKSERTKDHSAKRASARRNVHLHFNQQSAKLSTPQIRHRTGCPTKPSGKELEWALI